MDADTGQRTFDEILAGAKQGESWAVRVLFDELHPRLSRFVKAQEPRVAEDITAEVWEAVARGLDTFQGDLGGLRAWAFTIARRRLSEHRRRSERRRTEPVDAATFADMPAPDQPERDALERLAGQDAAAWVVRLLPPDQAEVVLLRVLGDLDTATVASILHRTENWVRVTQHRALRRLADRMSTRSGVTP